MLQFPLYLAAKQAGSRLEDLNHAEATSLAVFLASPERAVGLLRRAGWVGSNFRWFFLSVLLCAGDKLKHQGADIIAPAFARENTIVAGARFEMCCF